MPRGLSLVIAILVLAIYAFNGVYCHAWLADGKCVPENNPIKDGMPVETQRYFYAVSGNKMDLDFIAPHGKTITCVVAGATQMHGDVQIIDGGVQSKHVRVRYVSLDGVADEFGVIVQYSYLEPVRIEGNIAWNSRYALIFDPVKSWDEQD